MSLRSVTYVNSQLRIPLQVNHGRKYTLSNKYLIKVEYILPNPGHYHPHICLHVAFTIFSLTVFNVSKPESFIVENF